MKVFQQILRIFILCCIGDVISAILPFPLPGSIIALILLFVLLATNVIRLDQINMVADFLLKNMTFVFLPATLSIINYIDVFKSFWWKFLLICLATTVIIFLATYYSVKLTLYIMNKLKGGNIDAQ